MRVLTIIFLLCCTLFRAQEAPELPQFNIKNLKNQSVNKDSLLKQGKITVLNFWASWCDPCKLEMLEISQICKENEFQNVQFVSVTIDNAEGVNKAKTWFKKNKCSWSLYIDTQQDFFNKVLTATDNTSTAIPVCIVIDKQGRIKSFNTGFERDTYKEELLEVIRQIE